MCLIKTFSNGKRKEIGRASSLSCIFWWVAFPFLFCPSLIWGKIDIILMCIMVRSGSRSIRIRIKPAEYTDPWQVQEPGFKVFENSTISETPWKVKMNRLRNFRKMNKENSQVIMFFFYLFSSFFCSLCSENRGKSRGKLYISYFCL